MPVNWHFGDIFESSDKMDPFSGNSNEHRHKIETCWDRIEKRHINSAHVFDHTNSTAAEICENLIQNREFITGDQLKSMIGEKSKQSCINPNLLMDLRHSKNVSYKRNFNQYF